MPATVMRSVAVRTAPVNDLAVSPNGKLLYVATLASTAVYSTTTLKRLSVVPPDNPGDPLAVATTSSGLALVANGQGETDQPAPGSLTLIRGTQKAGTAGPLGFFAVDVAVTPNGKTTWVANFGGEGPGLAGYIEVFPTPQPSNELDD